MQEQEKTHLHIEIEHLYGLSEYLDGFWSRNHSPDGWLFRKDCNGYEISKSGQEHVYRLILSPGDTPDRLSAELALNYIGPDLSVDVYKSFSNIVFSGRDVLETEYNYENGIITISSEGNGHDILKYFSSLIREIASYYRVNEIISQTRSEISF